MRVTASGIARLAKCPAVAVLPWARQERKDSTFGTIVHAYLRDVPVKGRAVALLEAPFEHQAALDVIDTDRLPAGAKDSYAFEVAYIYNALEDTAYEVMRGVDRIEGTADAYLLTGTSDVVGLTDAAVVILDYKTGWYDYGPIEKNLQLITYALAAARAHGRDEAFIGIIRIKENGDGWWEWAHLTSMDLDGYAAMLRGLLERAEASRASGEIPTPVQGAHCKYCPAFDSCPAKKGLALSMMTEEVFTDGLQLTDEMMPELYERVQLRKAVLARVEEVMEERAATRPIRLADGWVYGTKHYEERRIDADRALPLLEEAYGPDVAAASVETKKSMTWKSLSRGLRPYLDRNKGKKISHLEKEARKMLEDRQAVKLKREDRVMKWQPDTEELAELLRPPDAPAQSAAAELPAPPPEGEPEPPDGD